MQTVDLTSDREYESDDQIGNIIMNETTRAIKTEEQDDSIEILELDMEESIRLIEPEMMAHIIKETQEMPQARRRSLRREARKPNTTKSLELIRELGNLKENQLASEREHQTKKSRRNKHAPNKNRKKKYNPNKNQQR